MRAIWELEFELDRVCERLDLLLELFTITRGEYTALLGQRPPNANNNQLIEVKKKLDRIRELSQADENTRLELLNLLNLEDDNPTEARIALMNEDN
ncbi:hypothetical protein HQ489_00530 [Candidatus Woesearchaeota archaeon]|nr:hypothetical protein [Candidatus Woesearchaeota archaeon]